MGKNMNLSELKQILISNKDKLVAFNIELPIPDHYHITEIGRETRSFIDCGGTKRKTERCVLQIWVANDYDHRLNSDKFLEILELGSELFDEEIEVYVEYEKGTVSQYPILHFKIDKKITFYLGKTHTACLAPEKCCKTNLVTLIKS